MQDTKDAIAGFIGKNIIVHLRGKKSLKGKLESVSKYDLFITVDYEPMIIMKHAIDYIELNEKSR